MLESASTTFKRKGAPDLIPVHSEVDHRALPGTLSSRSELSGQKLLLSLQERVTAEVSPCEGTSAVMRSPLVCLLDKLSRSSSLSPVSSLLALPHLGNLSRSTFQRAASPADVGPPISCMTGPTV